MVVEVEASVERWSDAPLVVTASITAPDDRPVAASAAMTDGHAAIAIPIDAPALWWPNGLGAQPLYQVQVMLQWAGTVGECEASRRDRPERDAEGVLDAAVYDIGLRTVELRREPDAWGTLRSGRGSARIIMGGCGWRWMIACAR